MLFCAGLVDVRDLREDILEKGIIWCVLYELLKVARSQFALLILVLIHELGQHSPQEVL